MTVFVDTSAFYALLDRNDPAHTTAGVVFERLLHAAEPLLTHNYVVLECIALVQRRLGVEAVRALRDAVLPLVRQVWVDPHLHDVALAATVAGRRKVSLVDRVSFEVMRRHSVARAFAFDNRFSKQGFELVTG